MTPLGWALNPAPGVPNLCPHARPVLTVHCILPRSCLNCEPSRSQAWEPQGRQHHVTSVPAAERERRPSAEAGRALLGRGPRAVQSPGRAGGPAPALGEPGDRPSSLGTTGKPTVTVTPLRQVSESNTCASACARPKGGASEAGPAPAATPRPDTKPRKCDLDVLPLPAHVASCCPRPQSETSDLGHTPPKVAVLNAASEPG